MGYFYLYSVCLCCYIIEFPVLEGNNLRGFCLVDKAVKTKNTSTRLGSNTAQGVERSVVAALPKWLSYPRVLRVVFGQLYRFGSLAECLDTLGKEIESFTDDWAKYVSADQRKELDAFALGWYGAGKLPKAVGKALTFTQINQQLFYEATMGSNALVSFGGAGAQDIKMSLEGGYGNHLEIERARHNAIRKARAEHDARTALENELFQATDVNDVFGGQEMEYNPFEVNASTEEND